MTQLSQNNVKWIIIKYFVIPITLSLFGLILILNSKSVMYILWTTAIAVSQKFPLNSFLVLVGELLFIILFQYKVIRKIISLIKNN
jgi:hypothetical protein